MHTHVMVHKTPRFTLKINCRDDVGTQKKSTTTLNYSMAINNESKNNKSTVIIAIKALFHWNLKIKSQKN